MKPLKLVALTAIVLAKFNVVVNTPSCDGLPVLEPAEIRVPDKSANKEHRLTHLGEHTHRSGHTKTDIGCCRDDWRQGLGLRLSGGAPHAKRRPSKRSRGLNADRA